MATITEDYCSKELSLLLDKKGFDGYSTPYSKLILGGLIPHSVAMKWLREVYNLYIQTEITTWPQKGYFVKIYLYKNRYNDFEEMPFVGHKKSYEEAAEAAIKYCLENLI